MKSMRKVKNLLFLGIGGYVLYKLFGKGKAAGNAPNLVIHELYLSRGDRGPGVEAIQIALNYLGYVVGPVDGIFGEQTQEAVRKFQMDMGIGNDGIVGPQTLRAIDEQLRQRGGSLTYMGV